VGYRFAWLAYEAEAKAKKLVELGQFREAVAKNVMMVGGIDGKVVIADLFIVEEEVVESRQDFIQPLRRAGPIGA
jgi:hypothetical protein